MSLHEAGAITGVGETRYLRGTDRTALSFQLEASLNAIRSFAEEPAVIAVVDLGRGYAVGSYGAQLHPPAILGTPPT